MASPPVDGGLLAHHQTVWSVPLHTVYGAAIGGLVGAAAWLINENDAGVKIGTGLVVGTVAGLIFGVADAQSLVQIEDGAVKLALPTPRVEPREGHLTCAVNLLHIPFK